MTLLPQNTEAEKCLLHQMMYEYGLDLNTIINSDLTTECFYDRKFATIYECIKSLYLAGENIDIVSMYDWMQREKRTGIQPYDISALTEVSCSNTATYYAQILLRCHWRRQGITICNQAIQKLNEEVDVPDEVIGTVADMLQEIPMSRSLIHSTLNDATQQVCQQMIDNLDPAKRRKGSMTGFRQIDETGGLPEVGVTIIAGDTGQGKSSLAVDLALQNMRAGEKVCYISLEMPQEDIARRIIVGLTGLTFHQLAYTQLTPDDQQKVTQAKEYLSREGAHRFFFDNRMESSVEGIVASIRKLADPKGEHVTHFYIDYVQILTQSSESARNSFKTAEQLLASAARTFHNLSVKLKIQIVLLSQVNRDHDNRELTLDRIRDSKQLADAATCVVLLYRPEPYQTNYHGERFCNVEPHGTALINVAKRRNGPNLQFICGFDDQRTHFYALDTVPQMAYQPHSFDI